MSEDKLPENYFNHCTLSDGRRVTICIPSYKRMTEYWNSLRDLPEGAERDPVAEMVELCADISKEEFQSLNILEAAKIIGAMAPLNQSIVDAVLGMEALKQQAHSRRH